jgi:hypothetical protein
MRIGQTWRYRRVFAPFFNNSFDCLVMRAQFERYRTSTDQKERIAEEIRRNLELEREEAVVAREERARLDRWASLRAVLVAMAE